MIDEPLARSRALHDDGFAAFYARERGHLARALGATLVDVELGAEAADEAMARAYAAWPKVSRYAAPAAWTYRVGFNWAVGRLRKRGRERLGTPPDVAFSDGQGSDTTTLAALAKLRLEHRSVVVLRLWMDWSVEDTARALDVSNGTVKSRLSRALDILRSELTTLETP